MIELLSVLRDPAVMLLIFLAAVILSNIVMFLYVWWKVK